MARLSLREYFRIYPRLFRKFIPARVRLPTDGVDGRNTYVPLLARVVNKIGVHEQDLVAVREILPYIIPVLLRRIVPYLPVTVVAVIDIDLAGGLAGSARPGRRNPGQGATQSASVL